MKSMIQTLLALAGALVLFTATSCVRLEPACPNGFEWDSYYNDCVPVACNNCGGGTVINNYDTVVVNNGGGGTQIPQNEFLVMQPFGAGSLQWMRMDNSFAILWQTTSCGGTVIYCLERPNYLNARLGAVDAYITVQYLDISVMGPSGVITMINLPIYGGSGFAETGSNQSCY